MDVVMMLNNDLLNVVPKACITPNFYQSLGNGVVHLYLLLAWSGAVCQCFSVFIIAFNRLTTLVFPNVKFWHYPYLPIFFILQVIPGLIAGSVTLSPKVAWVTRGCGVIGNIIDEQAARTYFKIGGSALAITAIGIIIMYGFIIHHMKTNTRFQGLFIVDVSQPSTKTFLTNKQKREFKLLIISAIICITQLIYTTYITTREIFSFDQTYVALNFIQDLCAGVNVYLLLIFSQVIRNSVKKHVFAIFGKTPKTNRSLKVLPPVTAVIETDYDAKKKVPIITG
uniref:Uncharacterized protein n=1 Tax=Panagrolaimus sp. JU765 TaxID=591449 RepID=A0AC34QBZ5_9BILA